MLLPARSTKLLALQHQRPGEKPKGVKGWIRDLDARGWSKKKTALVRTPPLARTALSFFLSLSVLAAAPPRRHARPRMSGLPTSPCCSVHAGSVQPAPSPTPTPPSQSMHASSW